MSAQRAQMTVVLPTRNRAPMVVAVLRLFRRFALPFRIVVADSSDGGTRALQEAVAACGAEWRQYPPEVGLYDKIADIVAAVDTPYVLLVPDKKITFPHSIDPLLGCLQARPDAVSASGYVARYGIHRRNVDIYRVHIFTPSVDHDDPWRRLFEQMRRYQPSVFALFRTEALKHSAGQAARVRGLIFQEIMFMNAVALLGKIARVPVVFGLHGAERSIGPVAKRDPLLWFLDDARAFFEHYREYCGALGSCIRDWGVAAPAGVEPERLIDLIHASWLGHNLDVGKINHVARGLLGDDMPPIVETDDWPGPCPVRWRDRVHGSATGRRRYVWRHAVLNAEPREEITISRAEIDKVERALDVFFED